MSAAFSFRPDKALRAALLLTLLMLLFCQDAWAQRRPAPQRKRPVRRAHAAPAPEPMRIETRVDRPASFPGLDRYLAINIQYPEAAREARAEGKAIVAFLVRTDGSVANVSIHRSSGYYWLDEEAMRVIRKMPQWRPAEVDGRFVSSSFLVPVNFELKE